MEILHQGDILKIEKIKHPVLVVSKAQLSEAVRRIKEYEGLKEIRVWTNSNLIAPKNYERVGFILYDTKENNDEAAFSGDYLD